MIEAVRSGRKGNRMLALAMLACALALRLLGPQGWMPVADAHGFRLTLCDGYGPMDMAPADMGSMAMSGGDHAMAAMPGMNHGRDGGHHGPPMPDHPCTYAGLGLALAEPVLPAIVAPLLADAVEIAARPLAVAIGRGLAAPPPPATGPPFSLA